MSQKRETLAQLIKFGIVGVSNTAISLIVYYIFIWINQQLYLWPRRCKYARLPFMELSTSAIAPPRPPIIYALTVDGPCYIRLARRGEPILYKKTPDLDIEKIQAVSRYLPLRGGSSPVDHRQIRRQPR